MISEKLSGEKISLDAVWFNRLMVPIGLFLLFLTGVGPLFAWRRTSAESLRRNFMWPGIASLALIGVMVAFGVRHFYALVSFGFCLFVALTVFAEFYKGARNIARRDNTNLARAAVELTWRNTRRYGGYLVHVGVVLMFVGFTGAAFNQSDTREVKIGDSMRLGNYTMRVADILQGENENYQWSRALMDVSRDGRQIGTLEPEKRFYKASRQGTSEVGVRHRLNEDLYLNFAGMSENNQRAVIQSYVFPLVSWIWIGSAVMVFGTLIALVPNKNKMQYARLKIVGMTREYAPVKK